MPGLRLPNPIPAERRLEVRSTHHLAGRVKVTVWRGRGIWLRGETRLAALEDGRDSSGAETGRRERLGWVRVGSLRGASGGIGERFWNPDYPD